MVESNTRGKCGGSNRIRGGRRSARVQPDRLIRFRFKLVSGKRSRGKMETTGQGSKHLNLFYKWSHVINRLPPAFGEKVYLLCVY